MVVAKHLELKYGNNSFLFSLNGQAVVIKSVEFDGSDDGVKISIDINDFKEAFLFLMDEFQKNTIEKNG